MARLPYAESELGLPHHIFGVLAHAPKIAKGFSGLGGRLLARTDLDPKIRELVINAVSVRLGAPYEWSHHAQPAIDAGATTADLEALRDGRNDDLGEPERTCVDYALKVEANSVTESDVESLRAAGLDDKQIVELTILAGFYGMTARFLRAMDVEYDEDVPTDFALPQAVS